MNNRIMLPIAMVIVSQSPFVLAAEYVIGATFTPTFGYDDNVQLREEKEGSFSTKIQPTLELSRAEANSIILFNTGLRVERYTELKDLDREDPFLNFSSNWNTERSRYGLTTSYAENAQRSIAEDDTGDFASNATVTSINFSPTYSYQLTEKDSINASYKYNERKISEDDNPIDNPLGTSLSDNETHTYTGGWQRSLTERLTGGLALTYATYEAESSTQQSEYDTYNFAVTSSYLLSEKWSLSGQVGYRTLESESTPVQGARITGSSSGSLFSFTSTYNGEVNNVAFSLSRSLSPSSDGTVNEQDRISLTLSRRLSEKLSFNLVTLYQESQSEAQLNTTEREFLQISPSMSWKLKDNLNLRFGYQYRDQQRSDAGDVDGNMVFMTVAYDWNGLRFSR